MKKNIIEINTIIKRTPFVSSLLSFFIIGSGQMYNGELLKGAVYLLFRFFSIAIFIFPVTLHPKQTYLNNIVLFFIFNCLILLLSSIDAGMSAFKKQLKYKPYNYFRYYLVYFFINSIVTFCVVFIFFSFFGFQTISKKNENFLYNNGDIIALLKKVDDRALKGMAVSTGDNNLAHVIGVVGDTTFIQNDIIYVNGSPLSFGTFTDQEKKYFRLENDEYLFYEKYFKKYPVRMDPGSKPSNKKNTITVKKDNYALINDDRIKKPGIITVYKKRITGRIEGVLISNDKKKLLIKPFIN